MPAKRQAAVARVRRFARARPPGLRPSRTTTMPKDAPLISVLMSVYNAGAYLRPALDSILAQTFDDFEFIIIDDGSSDRSPDLLREYAARNARIRLTIRPNQGLTRTLNEAIGLSRGEYLARMDCDD